MTHEELLAQMDQIIAETTDELADLPIRGTSPRVPPALSIERLAIMPPALPGLRVLRGGAGDRPTPAWGPCVLSGSYRTTANGDADRIAALAGEVLVRLSPGSPYSFSRYLVGTPDEVVADLIRRSKLPENEIGQVEREWCIEAAEIICRRRPEDVRAGALALAAEYRRRAAELEAI